MILEGRSGESGSHIWRSHLARLAHCAGGLFRPTERSVNGEPPHARGAVEGTGDRPPGSHPRLRRGRGAHLPGQDRQDAVPGAARGARGAPKALSDGSRGHSRVPVGDFRRSCELSSHDLKSASTRRRLSDVYADLRAGWRRALEEPLFGAAFFFAEALLDAFAVVLRPLTSSTLCLSASIRSTTGVSGAGSGFAISCPSSFASSICRRSLRYWLCSSSGSKSATRLSITCCASLSSASLTSVPATASSISAWERTSSARKSVSSTSASPFGRIRQKYSAPRSTKRPIPPMPACFMASSSSTYGRRCADAVAGER